jgi:hypothetical protein
MSEVDENGDSKEEFCGVCAALPLAMIGAGVAGTGTKKKGSNKKLKKILFWGGIIVTLISLIVVYYYLTRCKTCR